MPLALGWTLNKWMEMERGTKVRGWLRRGSHWKSNSSQEGLKAQVVSFWKFLKGPVVSESLWAMFSSWILSTFCFSSWCSLACRASAQGCVKSGCSEDLCIPIPSLSTSRYLQKAAFKCSMGVGVFSPQTQFLALGRAVWAQPPGCLRLLPPGSGALALWP